MELFEVTFRWDAGQYNGRTLYSYCQDPVRTNSPKEAEKVVREKAERVFGMPAGTTVYCLKPVTH